MVDYWICFLERLKSPVYHGISIFIIGKSFKKQKFELPCIMCGICGCFINYKTDKNDIKSKFDKMLVEMRHRGPNDKGYINISENPCISLGQVRLSIIDLSQNGHQPMVDPETNNIISFNGEIYNFQQIKDELKSKGHNFKTSTDTEVILKSYSEWGVDCLKKIKGIFSFAIFDSKDNYLFIARDHIGVKPLYYINKNNEFWFASEVRSLLSIDRIPRKLDKNGLFSYLSYGSVQEPLTLVEGIYSLKPGSYMIINSNGCKTVNYWDYPRNKNNDTLETAQKKVNELLYNAVGSQTISDVPLGAFLSGGIDSSVIVSLMRKYNKDAEIHTFGICFEDKNYDERMYARMVAKRNNTVHTELTLYPSVMLSQIDNAIRDLDLPSMDGINTWFVSKLVKEKGLTVALSGVGGDELFIGYSNFNKQRQLYKYDFLRFLPSFIGKCMENHGQNEKIRKLGSLICTDYDPYFISRKKFNESQIKQILCNSDYTNEWFETCFSDYDINELDNYNKISFFEMKTYMLSTLLRDTDQMSMAHSLEVRVPLLDVDLIEYVSSLPSNYKINKNIPKSMLVAGAREGIPDECIFRPKKGFELPYKNWINNELKSEVYDVISSNTLFNKNFVNKIFSLFESDRIHWSNIWLLYILSKWIRNNNIEIN